MLMKKIAWLSNLIYRLNVILIKIPASYFVDIDNLLLKFIWRGKKKKPSQNCPRIANTILKEKNKVEGRILPNFKTYCETTVIKTV